MTDSTKASKNKRIIAWAQAVAFVLGALLLWYFVRRVGVQPIFTALSRVGFGFFIIVALNGFRHVLRTISMRISVPAEHRRFTFMQAFAARLGGEAMSFLTFAGPLLGEPTKIALLRKRVPLVHGVPALVVDNLLYNLSVVLMIFGGAMLMLLTYAVPPVAREVLIDHRGHSVSRSGRRGVGHAETGDVDYGAHRQIGAQGLSPRISAHSPSSHLSGRADHLRFLQASARGVLHR